MNDPLVKVLMQKEIDKSLLVDGFTIPQKAHNILRLANSYPSRGEAKSVIIFMEGQQYEARIINVAFSGRNAEHSDVIQLRYSKQSPIAIAFQTIFMASHNYILGKRETTGFQNRTHIPLPKGAKEYVILSVLEEPFHFKIDCHPISPTNDVVKDDSTITTNLYTKMPDNKIVIKVKHGNDPKFSWEGQRIQKITTSISPMTAIELLKVVDNAINPREAKAGPITKAIFKTLEESPSLFWLKSKGILLATTSCTVLQEPNKVELSFVDPLYEGIMDGGHNFLAIANYLTTKFFNDQQKNWKDCKKYWEENYEKIVRRAQEEEDKDDSIMKFSIPIEIISPISEEEGAIEDYYKAISEICSARNNNVQLKDSAKGNQEGYYDYLKTVLSDFPIVWKTNESGSIKSEDVISWAILPLLQLQDNNLLISTPKLNKVSIYSSKTKCVQAFGEIISFDSYSTEENGKTVLTSDLVKSALDLTKDIITYFDRLFVGFPELFKSKTHSKLAAAAGDVIEKDKQLSAPFGTTDDKTSCKYPPAYIYPLVAGLTTMMRFNKETGLIEWRINPSNIDLSRLELTNYFGMMKMIRYEPQKIGKNKTFYSQACEAYRPLLGQTEASIF